MFYITKKPLFFQCFQAFQCHERSEKTPEKKGGEFNLSDRSPMNNCTENDMNIYDAFIADCRNIILNLKNAEYLKDQFEAALPKLQTLKLKPTFLDYVKQLFNIFHEQYGIVPFFMYRNEEIAYEWALELYWIILCGCEPTEDSPPNLTRAQLYKYRTNHTASDKVLANKFAEKQKSIVQQFSDPLIPLAYPSGTKYNEYITAFSSIEENSRKDNALSSNDYFFYIQNHHSSPYAPKNLDTGFLFKNFFEVISEYQKLHQNDNNDSFKSELSAFVFEKLYYGISFEKCICEFFKYNYTKQELPNVHWTLRCFCDFFNTHHLSLIDYFISGYSSTFFTAWTPTPSNEKVKETNPTNTMQSICALFQLYNSFYLPLLFHVLAQSLHDLYNGNTKLLLKDLRLFISERISAKNTLTYRGAQTRTHSLIAAFKNNDKYQKIYTTAYKTLFSEPKNDRIEYKFNKAFTKCFFQLKTVNYLNYYKTPRKEPPAEIIPTKLFDNIIHNYNIAKNSPIVTITENELLY